MPLDHYSACPGGTGKKIKFCCSDLVGELDKIDRMIEGEQFVACRDHVAKLDEKTPGRPCLLSWKLLLEQMAGDRDQATRTLTAFVAQHPNNPIALAETALARVQEGDVRVGIGFLQSAIEASGEQLHERVYAAIGAMGEILVISQQFLPARAHLMLQLAMSGGKDERPLEVLMRLESTPTVSVLLKDPPVYYGPTPAAPWQGEFEVALQLASRGWWRAAEARWEKLTEQAADSPALWHNLATVRGNLADYAGAIEALRRYAALPNSDEVSLDDAVEAEALAQLLDRENAEGSVDTLLVAFAVGDTDELERRLASDKQADRMQFDPRAFAETGEPPPRAAYWLLDRPLVTSGPELAPDQIPQILGQLLLFGKQTDREARLLLDVQRTLLPAAREVLQRIAGNALGEQQSEEVTGRVSAVQLAMSWQWRLPPDMTEAHRRKIIAGERRALVLDRWPNLSLPLLGGQTPADGAHDSANRARLLAAILLLEVSDSDPATTSAYDELRQQLGLPTPGPIDPASVDVRTLPLVRHARLDVEKLTDQQIADVFHRVLTTGYQPAIKRLSIEVTRRTSPELADYKLAAYRSLVHLEEDTDKALELIETARKTAEQARHSTAPWDLEELNVRIQRQEGQRVAELISHIRDKHGREPGVAEALMSIFMRLGMVGPDGRVRIPIEDSAAPAPGIVVPGAAAEAGKLWTPDSVAQAAKKSSLWVPE
jgi:tetratricopeptide (TPR) repeat protein